jgi:hypothetical protein
MEELLFALLVWIGRTIARGYRRTRDWLQGRQDAREQAKVRRPQAQLPGRTAAAADSPLQEARDELVERAGQVRDLATARAAALEASGAPAALAQTLEEGLAAPAERIRDAAARLPLREESAGELEQLEARLAPLEQLVVDVSEYADQRAGDRGRALLAADHALAALREPLVQWARHREGVTLPDSAPVAVYASPGEVDPALARLGLPVAALPRGLPREPFAWAALARALGRDLWRRMPGLRPEIHRRLGLPERTPVLFVSRGYWGQEEITHPFGPWLETLWADAVAAWLLGPAAGVALSSWLAQPRQPSRVLAATADRAGAAYSDTPPAHLRMVFTVEALSALGFEGEARALWEHWQQLHGHPQVLYVPSRLEGWLTAPLAPFETTAGQLAEGLLALPLAALGGYSLSGVEGVGFDEGAQARAEAVADGLATGAAPAAERAAAVRLAGALLARQRAGSGRAASIARWLLATFGPAGGARRSAPLRAAAATARAGRVKEPLASAALFRDAVVLDALLTRRGPGAPPPHRR